MNKVKDLTGQKFGRLVVLDRSDLKGSGRTYWNCICDCGNYHVVASGSLKSGNTTSCGCKRSEFFRSVRFAKPGNQHPEWKGYGEISGTYWKNVRQNARNRGRTLEISIKEAWELFLNQDKKCALSGLYLKFLSYGDKSHGTASLDRIDSSKGYVVDNVQWIHKDINRMKSNFDSSYFIEICNKISNFKKECLV